MRKTSLYLLLKHRNLSRKSRTVKINRSLGWMARTLTAAISLLIIVIFLLAGYAYARVARNLPSIESLPLLLDLENGELLEPTRIYDRSGEITLYTYQDEDSARKFLTIDPDEEEFISPQLVRSVTAAFDPSFWSNPGYSLRYWNSPEPMTIAERLVSELILWDEPPSTARALRMRILAGQVVSAYGRTKVIEWYLNSAWFGEYAYGVDSAARLYLGKSAQQVTLAESALLTSLLKSPALNPINAPETALAMQQELLRVMRASNTINPEEYELALKEHIVLRETASDPVKSANAFVRRVEKELEDIIPIERLRRGGLNVISSLDADLQEQLTCTAQTQLGRILYSNVSGVAPEQADCSAALLLPTQSFNNSANVDLAAAGLVMNPQTGEVLAYLEPLTLNGQHLVDGGYQPGSLLTPFVAVSAFSRGYAPARLLWDIPPADGVLPSSLTSAPSTYHGAVNIRSAIANNYLVPISVLVNEIGARNTWRSASIMGLDSLENAPDDPSPLFSGGGTSLFEIATAYNTLANGGVRSGRLDKSTNTINPVSVLKVTTNSNRLIWRGEITENTPIVSESVTYLVNHMLSDESARWPSLGHPNELEIGVEVAAKIGSADSAHQVWSVGYTPQRLVLVWIGNTAGDDNPIALDPRMAAGIWHAVFKYASRELEPVSWQRPAGITEMQVCVPSGMLPTRDCPNIMFDLFLYGNEPSLPDTLFTRVKVNRETGQLATVFTPPADVEEKVYMNIPPEARAWAQNAGIELIPLGYDSIQATRQDPQVNITQPGMFSPVSGRVAIRGTSAVNNFASYYVQVGEGINPENWLMVTEARSKVENGVLAQWETGKLNGLYAIRLTVIDTANRVRSAVTQVTVDNTPPAAQITYPQQGQSVQPVRDRVTITATVEDQVGIDRVEWWVDGKKVLEQTSSPYLYQLTGNKGNHTVYLKTWDTAGNKLQSDKINFQVLP